MAVINFLRIDFNIQLLKETNETDTYAVARAYLAKNAP